MRKLSEINESVFNKVIKRSDEKELRSEDGRWVETCLGNKVLLRNTDFDYNDLINDLLPFGPLETYIGNLSHSTLSSEEKANVLKGECTYDFPIRKSRGETLYISFGTYEDYAFTQFDMGDVTEKDYKNICKCINDKIQEVTQYIEYIPERSWLQNRDGSYGACGETNEYHLLIVDESTMYNYDTENDDDKNTVDDFLTELEANFPELEDSDYILFTYRNYGYNIAIKMSPKTINNIEKYNEFANKYFSND